MCMYFLFFFFNIVSKEICRDCVIIVQSSTRKTLLLTFLSTVAKYKNEHEDAKLFLIFYNWQKCCYLSI